MRKFEIETLDVPAENDQFATSRGRETDVVVGQSTRASTVLGEDILAKLTYLLGKSPAEASDRDWFCATALAVRDQILNRKVAPSYLATPAHQKHVYYLSMEFLIGRLLSDTMWNLGLTEAVREALAGLGVDLDRIRTAEPDAALGNGGLGRLAACFMESMASLNLPAIGYGIRYDYGLFRQVITSGWQKEAPDNWLVRGNPWEFERPSWCIRCSSGDMSSAPRALRGTFIVSGMLERQSML
jgi:starch phosphorylase